MQRPPFRGSVRADSTPLKCLTEATAEIAEDAEKAKKRVRNSFSWLCALSVLGGESVLFDALIASTGTHKMAATLVGRHILVTSGPTRGPIDAVRFVSNRSSGRLGCRIAIEALRRGARVTVVAGPQSALPTPHELSEDESARLRVLHVETVPDLMATLEAELAASPPDAVLHAMAVLDYVPEASEDRKTPSGRESWDIRLVRTPKVIRRIKDWAANVYLVEFKLEVGEPEERLAAIALESLRRYRADLVVANDLTTIRDEKHPSLIIAPDGAILARPQTKSEIARHLCDILAGALQT